MIVELLFGAMLVDPISVRDATEDRNSASEQVTLVGALQSYGNNELALVDLYDPCQIIPAELGNGGEDIDWVSRAEAMFAEEFESQLGVRGIFTGEFSYVERHENRRLFVIQKVESFSIVILRECSDFSNNFQ